MAVLLCPQDFKQVNHALKKTQSLSLFIVLSFDKIGEDEVKYRRSCKICKFEYDDRYFVKTNDGVVVCRNVEDILECIEILRTRIGKWTNEQTWAFALLFGIDLEYLENQKVGVCMIYDDNEDDFR